MKITDICVKAYSAPHRVPISNGKYTYASTDIVVAEVKTDEGVSGFGWTHGGNVVIQTLLSLKERITGEDPFNVERIWEKMYLPKVYGRKGFETRAISAIDIGLWDIIGKVAGRPVRQMLGGFQESVQAYIAGGYYEQDKYYDGLRKEMEQNIASGTKAVKMKIGGASIQEDLDRIDVVLDTVGSDVKVMVDANNAYNRLEALRMGKELDRRNIYWYEEPLHPEDLEGCAELSRRLDTPIAIGENEYTRWGFQQLVESHAAQIFNADAQVLGGITEWKKVADIAMSSHIQIAPHGDQEIHTHLVSAVPNGLIVEYYDNNTNSLLSKLFKNHIRLDKNGCVAAPAKPGLGVEFDFKAAEQYCIFSNDSSE